MKIEYHRDFSRHLNRFMEYKVYGHGGKPILVIPCQSGRFYEFEDMHMLDVYAPYIESGAIQVFTIDSIDGETYAAQGDCRGRIWWHEQWIKYITEEAIPAFSAINTDANGWEMRFGVVGLSLGAMHAATLFFRYPDVFDALMGLSGLYSSEDYFGYYHDDLIYNNSPEQFLSGMPFDHPYLEKYRRSKIILCVGQGAWENVTYPSTLRMGEILNRLGVPARIEIWGQDVVHDWDWWYIQAAHFLPDLLSF